MERKVVTGNKGSYRNITILNHHLLRDYHIYSLEKLNTKELYCFSICFSKNPNFIAKTPPEYFSWTSIKWRDAYILYSNW